MHIGAVELRSPLLLAPMAGLTDAPFRRLCQRFGAGLTCCEMVAANPALRTTRTSRERLVVEASEHPLAMQIVGADPQAMADQARYCVDQGAAIIDINLGCPARKVCRQAAGSALLRDEPLIGRILSAVVSAVTVPVTVKTLTGWSPNTRNLDRIAALAVDHGIALLSVHGRTRACSYAVAAEHDSLAAVRPQVRLPLAANGDIDSPQRAKAVLDQTGADALMIGRAALGQPWIFAQIRHFLHSGELMPAPSLLTVRTLILEHLESLYAWYGNQRGVLIARKHLSYYQRRLAGELDQNPALLTATTPLAQRQAALHIINRDEAFKHYAPQHDCVPAIWHDTAPRQPDG